VTDTIIVELHDRIAALRAAADRTARRTPVQAAALLTERAALLARPPVAEPDAEDAMLPALVVQIGDEQIAMPLEHIVTIARAGSIAPLPRAMRPVYGVTAWRGRPLTVLSLTPGKPAIGADTRLLVLGTGARAALAVIVDTVHEVRDISRARLSPAGVGPRRSYTLGITSDSLLVLDGAALLNPESLVT
jgi:chemotaxis signal transduction protein